MFDSGLMPYNYITAKAGGILSELKDVNQIFDTENILKLVVLAILILLPTLFKSQLSKVASINLDDSDSVKEKSS
jgi:hypothetical protein